jgi:hypothetical protein
MNLFCLDMAPLALYLLGLDFAEFLPRSYLDQISGQEHLFFLIKSYCLQYKVQ